MVLFFVMMELGRKTECLSDRQRRKARSSLDQGLLIKCGVSGSLSLRASRANSLWPELRASSYPCFVRHAVNLRPPLFRSLEVQEVPLIKARKHEHLPFSVATAETTSDSNHGSRLADAPARATSGQIH